MMEEIDVPNYQVIVDTYTTENYTDADIRQNLENFFGLKFSMYSYTGYGGIEFGEVIRARGHQAYVTPNMFKDELIFLTFKDRDDRSSKKIFYTDMLDILNYKRKLVIKKLDKSNFEFNSELV